MDWDRELESQQLYAHFRGFRRKSELNGRETVLRFAANLKLSYLLQQAGNTAFHI
jgi:hypothetical protein